MFDLEHPDITAALRTGYPRYAVGETPDTMEARMAYAEETMMDFFKFLVTEDPEVLERYCEANSRDYKDWRQG